MTPNYAIKSKTSAFDTEQIAYPVGEAKDSYSIQKWFVLDVETHEVTVQCTVVKNWIRLDAEKPFSGTYKECYNFIADLIKDI